MLHALIMAGGSGTRFWPASRAARPKQLLNLTGGETMIQATAARLVDLMPPERVLILTAERLVAPIAEQLPQLPAERIVGEPCRRDTAPCIGLAAALLRREDADAVMVVMPADHVIEPVADFQQALERAGALVAKQPDTIVTFGILPTYAAESFGYIQRGEMAVGDVPDATYRVAQFREKPNAKTAQQYLQSGDFYWNSGIFVWSAQTILAALQRHQPDMYVHLMRIADAIGTDEYAEVLQREFTAIEPVSIDYAVMEHHRNTLVIEAPFSWDDVGSWQALSRLSGTDDQGNTINGRHVGHQAQGCIVRTDDSHLVATLGVRDLIVVHTPDATLVANKHDEESIRALVELIRERGWEEYL